MMRALFKPLQSLLLASLAGRYAANDIAAVLQALSCMEAPLGARNSLDNYF